MVLRIPATMRRGLFALVVLLVIVPAVSAQSITDASRIEFTPSADNNAVDPNSGTALVTNYTLDVYVAGGTTIVATANLGKPTPDADGMMRVDFVAQLTTPLASGLVYESVLSAVGPGGSASTPRSNTFAFTVPCAYTISPTSSNLTSSAATTGSMTITAGTGCGWTAISSATSWLTVTAGANGSGNGSVSFSVASNPNTSSRTGTITIGGQTFTVTQAASTCSFAISPTSQSIPASGGTGTVSVTTSSNCSWTASGGGTWVTITSGASGTGSGTVGYTAASNTGTIARSVALTIAGRTLTINEPGSVCTFTLSPTVITAAPTGASGTITVTTQSNCAWTASSNATWATVTGSRSGSGTATYTIQANNGIASRSAAIAVGGIFVGVSQTSGTPTTPPHAPSNLRVIK